MLTTRYKATLNAWLAPLATAVGRLGISPSAITVGTVLLTIGVCGWFVQTRRMVPFAVIMLLVGSLDGLDGAVARASGRVTKFGAYLDAMCDRYVETLVALSVAVVTGYWLLSLAMLSGSLLVSYAKARTAMEVSVSNQEWPDLMERAERDILYLLGLAAGSLIAWKPLGHDLFWWTLLALSVLVHGTVLQRMVRARHFIGERE
ncbi:MAG: hypothetical protein COV75_08335 [Candidatus Omnitrophica bacterium CG11_big_fil_rev_8_21_14_0_20_63_9]|nr:MAG: hypothetical protein COV75_08335 [Candidatus Omnitrophica bacterium CG11_big_fil_rev_8_21_14_0_20_63_9]